MFPFSQFVTGLVIVILLSGLRVAQEYERGVIFRLGRFKGLRGPGLYWIIPLGIERSVTDGHPHAHRLGGAAGNDHPRQRHDQGQCGALVSHHGRRAAR